MTRILPLALAAILAVAASPAPAQEAAAPRIVVTGEGENAIAPDMALLSLGVMNEAKTAREALAATDASMAKVIEALKTEGVAPRDLQTGGLQIAPTYQYTNKPDGTQTSD